jgi:N-acetylmuramoyl-L-alanine amidase
VVALAIYLLLPNGIVDLDEMARRYEIKWSSEAATGRHTVRAGNHTLVFVPGFQSALVNGMPMTLGMPVTVEGGRIKLPPELARYVETAPPRRPISISTPPVKAPLPPPAREEKRSTLLSGVKIAIDAGHGGMHTGGKGNRLMEKDINLAVALNLQKILESWGAKVVMTRTTDRHFDNRVDEDLDARVDIVNGARPDLFLSVHTNFVANAGPRGFEVWVPRCNGSRDRLSRDLAELIRDDLGEVWGSQNDRGTKDEHNLRVLKGTHCPAALVELEFISNPSVERQLGREDRQQELAGAIAEGARTWVMKHLR